MPATINTITLISPGHWPFSIMRLNRGKAVFTAWHEGRTYRSLLPGYKWLFPPPRRKTQWLKNSPLLGRHLGGLAVNILGPGGTLPFTEPAASLGSLGFGPVLHSSYEREGADLWSMQKATCFFFSFQRYTTPWLFDSSPWMEETEFSKDQRQQYSKGQS